MNRSLLKGSDYHDPWFSARKFKTRASLRTRVSPWIGGGQFVIESNLTIKVKVENSAITPERSRQRRQFVDELKAHIPVHPITETTAEIIARVGGEQAAKGINLPFIDLVIGACALELGYSIGTDNVRDFNRIPDLTVISL